MDESGSSRLKPTRSLAFRHSRAPCDKTPHRTASAPEAGHLAAVEFSSDESSFGGALTEDGGCGMSGRVAGAGRRRRKSTPRLYPTPAEIQGLLAQPGTALD